jgi:hypothetical protein
MRSKKQKERQHGNQLLSDKDEHLLVGLIFAMAREATPLSRQVLINLVRKVSWVMIGMDQIGFVTF